MISYSLHSNLLEVSILNVTYKKKEKEKKKEEEEEKKEKEEEEEPSLIKVEMFIKILVKI